MSSSYLIDTHPFIWWLSNPGLISRKVLKLIQNSLNNFHISTISLLEIQYLIETGKVVANVSEICSYIKANSNFYILPYDEIVLMESLHLSSFRDPFDRIITSTALAYNFKLITKDTWIKDVYPKIVLW